MKLATEASVLEAMQIDGSIMLIEQAVISALHAATEEAATLLLADFDAGTYTDDFHVLTMLQAGQCYTAQLALAHGFLSTTPVVKAATTYAGLADAEALDAGEYKVDAEKGAITLISATDYTGYYVRVTYAAGFAVDETDDELFLDVPGWLQVAATKLSSAIIIETNPDLASDQNGNGRDPLKLRASAERMLEKKTRYFPSPIRPF